MPTVLVADDNSNIQKMVGLALEEHGITVVAVGNGEAAVRKLPDVHPDVVLADIFMPVRNGYEVCEFIKKDPKYSHIPVILLIGAFDPLDEKEAHRVGANGVLKKPFVPPDPLIAMVTGFVAGAEKRQESKPAPRPAAQEEAAPPPVVEMVAERGTQSEELALPASPVTLHDDHAEPETTADEPVPDWRREAMAFDVPAGLGASTNSMDEAESVMSSAPAEEVTHPDEAIRDWPPSSVVEATSSPDLAANPTDWRAMMSPRAEQPAVAASDHIAEVPSEDFVPETPAEEAAPSAETSSEAPPEMLWQPAAGLPVPPEAESESPSDGLFEELPPVELDQPGESPSFELTAFSTPTFTDPPPAAPAFTDEPAPHATAYAGEIAPAHESVPGTSFAHVDAFPAPPAVDAAIVDAIVARVLERIEPQIHDILAREVLRPLAESLLHQELQKK